MANNPAKFDKAHQEFSNKFGTRILKRTLIEAYYKALGFRADISAIRALEEEIYQLMLRSVVRCDENDRTIVRAQDI